MTAPGCPVTGDVDWLGQEFLVDPYPELADLREQSPVFFDEELGYYLVTRYEDIERCLTDRTTFLAQGASSPVWPPVEAAQQILTEQGYKRVPTLEQLGSAASRSDAQSRVHVHVAAPGSRRSSPSCASTRPSS